MAFSATNISGDARAASEGPLKRQLMKWTCVSGDTSGTVTADGLYSAQAIIIDGGLIMNAAPTYSGNVVTLSFNDPVATLFGDIMVLGK